MCTMVGYYKTDCITLYCSALICTVGTRCGSCGWYRQTEEDNQPEPQPSSGGSNPRHTPGSKDIQNRDKIKNERMYNFQTININIPCQSTKHTQDQPSIEGN